jgi:hypothetical protein
MLRNLREFWRRRVTGREDQLPLAEPGYERRSEERRKQNRPWDGPERRRGKDRRQYVRRVMTGEESLPDQERRSSR